MPCCTIDGHVADPHGRGREMPEGWTPGTGAWLLARLAVHHHYNRGLARNVQEPLWGSDLNRADRLEVARLVLELADAERRRRFPERGEP